MTDRETLEKVAAGYHSIVALQAQQRATMATILRSCLAHIRSSDPRKRKQGLDGLSDMADLLEGKTDE